MKKILLLIFLSVIITSNLYAQDVKIISISGKIIDSISKTGLHYATIILKEQSSENTLGIITDKNGLFKISVPEGKYNIVIEFLSYQSKTYSNFELKKDVNFGSINLSPVVEVLDAVEIRGNVSLVSYKLGKKIYNVEKDISAQGRTAIDILENAPSVSVENGVPMIRGTIATVLINGRISALSKTEALENLQASTIKKIEVITSPSARYSANMNGGIINIILKKGLDNGFNGSVTTTLGIEKIYGAAGTFNYRKNKLNIYTNTSYFNREPISNATINNEYFNNGSTTGFLTEDRLSTRKNIVFNTTLGIDYYVNDYAYLNFEGSFGNYNGDFNSNNTSNYFGANKNITSSIEQLFITDHSDDIYNLSVTYNQYFGDDGKQLYMNISHENDKEINNSLLLFKELFPSQTPEPDKSERIFDDLDLTNTTWKTYYVFPTSEKATLEFGSDGEIGKLTSNFTTEIIQNGSFITNPTTSNILDYQENWVGLYAEYIRNSNTFSFLLGFRTEYTDLTTDLILTNQYNSQKYTDIFPSVQLEYNLKEDKILSLTYARRIQRVNYPRLNPFEQRISETTTYKGNSNLLPFYPNNFELSIINKSGAKFTINPALYFRNYDNIWQNITVETGEIINGVPKLVTTPINLGYLNFVGLELLTSYKPNKKLEFNSTFDFNYSKQDGIYEYTNANNKLVILDYASTGFSGSIDLNTTLKLPLDINFQSLIKYNFASEGAYSKRYGYAYMDVSLSKDLFNKNATLSLNAKDLFNSYTTKRLRWTDDVNSLSNFQWREPSIILSFTYRFNQSKKDRTIDINKNDVEIKY